MRYYKVISTNTVTDFYDHFHYVNTLAMQTVNVLPQHLLGAELMKESFILHKLFIKLLHRLH